MQGAGFSEKGGTEGATKENLERVKGVDPSRSVYACRCDQPRHLPAWGGKSLDVCQKANSQQGVGYRLYATPESAIG